MIYHRIGGLAALLSITLALVPGATAAPTHTTVASATIATTSSADFRAELVATRTGSGRAPTATVTLTTFQRASSAWHELASRRIAGSFFWKTVTGSRAICRFELASAVRPHVTAQLLLTPAVGCGKTTTIALPSR